MFAIDIGALQREIDEADRDAIVPDRNLAQQQWRARSLLQNAERLAHIDGRGVDLVQENEMRHAELFELAQHELQRRYLAGVGLANDDRRRRRRQNIARLMGEFDGARQIDECVVVAQIIGASRYWPRRSSDGRGPRDWSRRRWFLSRRGPAAGSRRRGPEEPREAWSCRIEKGPPAQSAAGPVLSPRENALLGTTLGTTSGPSLPPYGRSLVSAGPVSSWFHHAAASARRCRSPGAFTVAESAIEGATHTTTELLCAPVNARPTRCAR